MLKLLLPHKEKIITRIYRLRFLTLFFYGIIVIALYYAITLVPAIVEVQTNRSLFQKQIEAVKDPVLNKDKVALRGKVADVAQTLMLLDKLEVQVSSIVRAITASQFSTIAISSIEFESEDDVPVVSVQVRGVSADRESLALFVARLDEEEQFQSVDLPFSSFTRGTDVPFAISITANQAEGVGGITDIQ
jgi:hypothetical protein